MVTVTSTVPLTLGAGLVTVIWLSLSTEKPLAGTDPKPTAVAPVKPVPATVTLSPPPAAPLDGLTPVTTGASA